jgi:hypothetical protein
MISVFFFQLHSFWMHFHYGPYIKFATLNCWTKYFLYWSKLLNFYCLSIFIFNFLLSLLNLLVIYLAFYWWMTSYSSCWSLLQIVLRKADYFLLFCFLSFGFVLMYFLMFGDTISLAARSKSGWFSKFLVLVIKWDILLIIKICYYL